MKSFQVNQSCRIYFAYTSGLTEFPGLILVKDTAVDATPITVTELVGAPGLYFATLTPTSTGRYVLFLDGSIIAEFEVVTKTIYSFLQNIEDEAIGSWAWDKQLNKLKMIRQDGTVLAEYDVVENMSIASRERI